VLDDAEPLLALFERQDFNAVPVVDGEGHLLRVVTKLSLLRLLRRGAASGTTEPPGPPGVRVRDVMDTRAVWVDPADALDAVVRQMTRTTSGASRWSSDRETAAGWWGW
jgi:CBS domain-containing protein